MIIDIVTIFPEFFDAFINTSIIKRSIEDSLVEIRTHQLRDYSHQKHNKIDDTPYGGGVGMLMQFPPFYDVIKKLKTEDTKVVLLSPQGKLFNQELATDFSKCSHIILLCGHYEGIDARVEDLVDLEISIGDYVLTGGEIPAMIIADAVIRLIPGVIHEDSTEEDSLQSGWIKYPQYTKPEQYEGYRVPEVLLSGHHKNIEMWRKEQTIYRTMTKRPDLFNKVKLSDKDKKMVEKVLKTLP